MGQVLLKPHRSGTVMAQVEFKAKKGQNDPEILADFKGLFSAAVFNWSTLRWTVALSNYETVMAMVHFTRKYGFTVDHEELEHLSHTVPHRPTEFLATYEDSVVRLRYPYTPDLNAELPKIQGARFNSTERCWDIVLTLDACEKLLPLFMKWGFKFDSAVTDAIGRAFGTEHQAIKDSAATTAELPTDLLDRLKMTPYDFQRAGIKFAMERERVLIADQMGLGKTIQAIGAVEGLNAYRVLCVVPNSMRLTWIAEWRRACPHRKVATLYGERKRPLPVVVNGVVEQIPVNTHAADVIVVNYDQVRRFKAQLKRWNFKAVILDESHYIKSEKTQRTKAVLEVVQGIKYRFLLTGTPVLNAPWELPTQLQAAGRIEDFGGITRFKKDWLGGTLRSYMGRTWMEYDQDTASEDYQNHLEQLNQRLRPFMIRRYKKDVYRELPDKTRTVTPLEIDNQTEYRLAERDLIGWVKEQAADTFKLDIMQFLALDEDEQRALMEQHKNEAATRAMKGYAMRRIQVLRQLAVKGKLAESIAWIKEFLESGEKLVVYAIHRDIQAALLQSFPDAARLHGDDSILVRKRNELRFQDDPSCKLVIASVFAAAEGLTLTAASNLAILEMPWTPGKCTQVEDRIHRIGQSEPCTITYLLASDTIDEWLAAKVESKRKVVDAVTEGEDAERVFEGSIVEEMMLQLMRMGKR